MHTKSSPSRRAVPPPAGRTTTVIASNLGYSLLVAASLLGLLAPRVAGAAGIVWGEPIEVASGKALRGPWLMNESRWHFVDDPTVAIDDRGEAGVAWADHAGKDIFFQVYEPDGKPRLAEPVNVSRSPATFSWLPRVVMTSGKVFVLWQEIVFSGGTHGGEIFFARSTDGGRSFHPPLNLSNTIAGAGKGRLTKDIWFNGSLDLARSAGGNLYAAWTVYEGGLFFARSTDGGESFSGPLHLAGGGRALPARGPALAAHGDTVELLWSVGESRDADIRIAVSADAGKSFAEPRVLFATPGHSEAPKIAADRDGVRHVVFGESPAGPLERYHIRHTRAEEGSGGFSEPRMISGRHSEIYASVNFPSLDLDGRGNIYVLWEIFPEEEVRPRGLGLTFSGDGGKTWAPPALVPGSFDPQLGFSGSQQGLYMKKLAVGGAGEIAIVNSTFKENESSHIWLIRGRFGEE